ncbi:hypothetical protein [Escherichia coli]
MQITFFHLFGKDKKSRVMPSAALRRMPASLPGFSPEAMLMPGEAERTPA